MPFVRALEETLVANLLLHVVDLSNPQFEEHMQTTLSVLNELESEDETNSFSIRSTLARSDNLNLKLSQNCNEGNLVFVSCESGEGLSELLQLIEEKLGLTKKERTFLIPHDQYRVGCKNQKRKSGQ